MLLIGIVCRLRPASPPARGDREARHSVKEDRNGGNRSGTMIHLDRLLQGKMRYDKLIKTHMEEKQMLHAAFIFIAPEADSFPMSESRSLSLPVRLRHGRGLGRKACKIMFEDRDGNGYGTCTGLI